MNDLISRRAAINAIRNIRAIRGTSDDSILLIDKAEAQTELMMLPSVQPEPSMNSLSSIQSEVHTVDIQEADIVKIMEQLRNAKVTILPSVEPEVKPISYIDCANAMLKMWIDEVLTDDEYNRIMDKLNAKQRQKGKSNE